MCLFIFFGATFLPYWYHPSFLAARQVVWSDTWRKNRTVHLGLNAEWGSVWKSLLEPYINLELQTRPYCISIAGDWSGCSCACTVLLTIPCVVLYILPTGFSYSKSIGILSLLFSSTELRHPHTHNHFWKQSEKHQNFDDVCEYWIGLLLYFVKYCPVAPT